MKIQCPSCCANLRWKKMIFRISRYRCESCGIPLRISVAVFLGVAVPCAFILSFGKLFIPNGMANAIVTVLIVLTFIFAPREIVRE